MRFYHWYENSQTEIGSSPETSIFGVPKSPGSFWVPCEDTDKVTDCMGNQGATD